MNKKKEKIFKFQYKDKLFLFQDFKKILSNYFTNPNLKHFYLSNYQHCVLLLKIIL